MQKPKQSFEYLLSFNMLETEVDIRVAKQCKTK